MGTAERKEREKAELKELILKTAKDILVKNGQDGLSIRKIASIVEYSPATIYLYFKDKDEILHELMEVGFKMMGSYMKHISPEMSPIERIHKTGEAYIKFGLENKDWYDLMFNSEKPMKHIFDCGAEWNEGMNMFNFLVLNCEQAIKENNLTNLEPQILALQLWSTVHGLVNLTLSERMCIVVEGEPNELINKTLTSMLVSIFNQVK